MKGYERVIDRTARRFGLVVSRVGSEQSRLPVEATDEQAALIASLRPYTMTSAERLWSLLNAVRYVVEEGIPGDFAECGVWRGGSVMAMALQLQSLGVTDRRIWLYDTFAGMTAPTEEDVEAGTGTTAADMLSHTDVGDGNNVWCVAGRADVEANVRSTGYPMDQFTFVEGDVAETLRHHVPETISVLRLDTDWYESTRVGLEVLYPRLAVGGRVHPGRLRALAGCPQGCRRVLRRPRPATLHAPDRLLGSTVHQDPLTTMPSPPWLTVVTVVRDDRPGLERTVASVAAQDRDGVEYLIIDSSADRTAIPDVLDRAGVATDYHWTAPEGIYPAMNAGLAEASGTYTSSSMPVTCCTVRAVLSEVRRELAIQGAPWAFGPVEIVSRDGTRTVTPPWDYHRERSLAFSRGHFPAHQGTFAGTDLLRQVGGFDPAYPIVADYAAFLRMSLLADPLLLQTVVATFVEGGLSTRRWKASVAEFHQARRAILTPTGPSAWRERYETTMQFGRLWIVRDLLRRGR